MDTQARHQRQKSLHIMLPPERQNNFVDKLINKRFTGLKISFIVRAQLQTEILIHLDAYIVNAILDKLTDQDAKDFERFVNEGKSVKELRQFILERIPEPQYSDFMKRLLLDFERKFEKH